MSRVIRIVGICGSAGAGKSTAAKYLVDNYGFMKMSFADPIKAIAKNLFPDAPVGDRGGAPLPSKYRRFYQQFGTDAARCVDPDVWVRLMRDRIESYLASQPQSEYRVVIDDLRFPNEVEMVQEYDGGVIRISLHQSWIRRLKEWLRPKHLSETALRGFKSYDLEILRRQDQEVHYATMFQELFSKKGWQIHAVR